MLNQHGIKTFDCTQTSIGLSLDYIDHSLLATGVVFRVCAVNIAGESAAAEYIYRNDGQYSAVSSEAISATERSSRQQSSARSQILIDDDSMLGAPLKPQLSAISGRSIQLTWRLPRANTGALKRFDVLMATTPAVNDGANDGALLCQCFVYFLKARRCWPHRRKIRSAPILITAKFVPMLGTMSL